MQAAITPRYAVNPVRRSAKRIRRVRTLRLLGVLVVLLGVLVLGPRAVHMMPHTEAPPVATYTVNHGETLWEIASRYSAGQDVRKVIYAIRQANRLPSATVWPGQVLVIPRVAARR